jgi:predicted nuclease with TOPRIM domain
MAEKDAKKLMERIESLETEVRELKARLDALEKSKGRPTRPVASSIKLGGS